MAPQEKPEKETWIRLVGRINHEINNPLAILAGYNSMLKRIAKRIDNEKEYREIIKILERSEVAIHRIHQCQAVLQASSEESDVRRQILGNELHYIEEIEEQKKAS